MTIRPTQASTFALVQQGLFDNYARLTCHWGKAGNPHTQPGMEAYFAQEPWDPVKD